MKYDGEYYLNLELKFNSKDVKKSYGTINKEDFLKIQLIEGHQVFLNSVSNSEAEIEQYTGKTIYKSQFKFKSSDDLKLVGTNNIDFIGIMWSSGFEDYTLYEIDALKKQIKCLKDGE
jgi:hypothetical protein